MFDSQIPTAYVEVIKTLSLFHVKFDLNNDVCNSGRCPKVQTNKKQKKQSLSFFLYLCLVL